MRRLIITVLVILVIATTASASWLYLRPHDRLAEARQFMAKGDARSAELVLRGIVRDDPTKAEALVRLGQVQMRLGDPVAAEKQFRAARANGWDSQALVPLLAQAIVTQGRNDEVLRDYVPDGLTPTQAAATLVARARAQMNLKRPDEATASIAQAQNLDPQSLETAVAAAQLAAACQDRIAEAANIDAALAIDPHALEPLMLQADLRIFNHDNKGALASYATALQSALAQSNAATDATNLIRLSRASLLLATNDDAAARTDVDAVLKTQSHSPLANFLSARLLARAGDWKSADAALSLVGPVLPRLPGGEMLLAIIKINVNEPEQAIEAAQRQVARTPANLDAVKLLARLELTQKRPDVAAQVLTATPTPLDGEALDLMGSAYVDRNQPTKALDSLKQASKLLPDDPRVLTRLAALEMAQGQAGLAVQALNRALNLTTSQPAPAATNTTPVAYTQPPSASLVPTQAQTAATLVAAALQAGDIDRAVTALEQLRQAKGDPVELALLTGRVKMAQIDLPGAQAAFENARTLAPTASLPRINLARLLALQGHSDQAVTMLQEVMASNPSDTLALIQLTNLLLETNQPDKAVAAGEAARQASPDNLSIAVGVAGLYLRAKQTDKALALLDTIEKKPGAASVNAALLTVRLQAQMTLGQRPAAEQTLRSLLNATPENVALRRQLAELMTADKNYDGARAVLREGLMQSPGNAVLIATSVAVANSEGGALAAVSRADELARDPANAAVAATLKGDVLMGQRKFAEAAASYQDRLARLPKNDPNAGALQVHIAEAIAASGDPTRAATLMRDWLTTHPNDDVVMLALSTLNIGMNHLSDARVQLEAVLTRQPNNPTVLNNLAWIHQQQGDLAVAHTMAAQSYLLSPSPQSADTLGWILLEQNYVSEAVILLQEAARGQPPSPAIEYHLAAAMATNGQKEEAVTLLKALTANQAAAFDEKPKAIALLSSLSAP